MTKFKITNFNDEDLLLLIDTSNEEAGVALVKKGEMLADRRWGGDPGAVELLKEMDKLLEGAGKRIKDINKVVVCEGLGRRYSALRTGVVTGMILAYAEGIELAAYTRKSSDALFENVKLRSQLVLSPKYEKSSRN